MGDIRTWLQANGLGKHADALAAHDVDFDILPEITEAELSSLGLSFGDRKRLLRAIRELEPSDRSDLPSIPRHAGRTPCADRAERRQLTVMFCDIVGSTELSQQLDPEDLRDVIRAYQDTAKVAIERFDGYVARYMGDGVLAYFGYPLAHEDDAERAVRAGLALVESVEALDERIGRDKKIELAVRIGLATGPVVVGDVIGEGASLENAVVGETPNVAARIEALAEPGSVYLGETTRRLVRGAFDLEELGAKSLKGLAQPVQVYRALRAADVDTRFEARATALSPLVARDAELGFLVEQWDRAKRGEGRAVLISGEPGVGKSRLSQALLARIGNERHDQLQYQCSPHHTNSAFHPVVNQLKHAAGFDHDDAPRARLRKLETFLAQTYADVATAAPLLAAMLSLPTDDYPPLDLTPARRKRKTIEAIVDLVCSRSGTHPVLLVFEDAHWADPTTVEVLEAILAGCRDAPVLVVVTHRPEFAQTWPAEVRVSDLSLDSLGRTESAALVTRLAGGKTLPDAVMDEIVDRCDGIPLYTEELTRSVLEAGFLEERADGYVLDGPIPPLAIPATLHDSLLARLDRLPHAKDLAQTAACIGREFPHDLLAAVAGLGERDLSSGLRQLVGEELVQCSGAPPKAVYTFRHALIRDAAYDSLLLRRRRSIHALIGRAMETLYAERLGEHHGVLAHHFENAERWSEAFEYLCVAASGQASKHALGEAIRLYEQASAIGERPESDLDDARLVPVHREITNLLFTQGRFLDSLRQGELMASAARRCGDSLSEAMAFVAMASAAMWAEDFPEATRLATKAADLGTQHGHAPPLAGGTMIAGIIHALTGRLEESDTVLQRSVRISREAKEHSFLAPAICFHSYRENWKGRFDAAISLADEAERVAEEQKQVAWSIRCQWTRGAALVAKGDYDDALAVLRGGLALAEKVGDAAYIPRYVNTLGWLYNECHAFELGAQYNERAVALDAESTHATGVERTTFALLNWADAMLALGDLAEARELLDRALGIVGNPKTHDWMKWRYTTHAFSSMAAYWTERGEPGKADEFVGRCLEIASAKESRKYVAMARRLAGQLALHRRDEDTAEAALRDALEVATSIGYPAEVWRARAALGELHALKGDRSASAAERAGARTVLTSVRERLTDEELRASYGRSGAALRALELDECSEL